MASILKASRAPAVVDRLEVEARERASQLLAASQAEAARVREAVHAEREELLRAAAHAGLEEGRARAAAALAEVAAAREASLRALDGEVAAVALEVARRILGEALGRPDAVVELARRALERVRSRREVLLRVNPEDLPHVREGLPALAALLERAPSLGLREDPGVERGGVVVETEAGRVEARVEAQLALLEQALGARAP
jgi:type III secretion system HrpE/YscL family protein